MTWPKRNERAEKIKSAAAEWIVRRDAGLSTSEEAEFERWRAADARHARAVEQFEGTWKALTRPRLKGSSTAIASRLAELDRRQRRRVGLICAALAGLVTTGVFWRSHRMAVAPAAVGQTIVLVPEHRTLSDGSEIESTSDSKLAVNYDGFARRVTLEKGQAFFEVAKNASRPFVVSADGFEVRAVGTAFSVQVGQPGVEVLVTEGRVTVNRAGLSPPGRVAPSADLRLAVVDAGRHVTLNAAQRSDVPTVTDVSAEEIAALLAWRNPRLEFSGKPLGEVVAVINRYNHRHFVVVDPTLASVPVSGRFGARDTDTILRMLEVGFGIKGEAEGGDRILLRRAP